LGDTAETPRFIETLPGAATAPRRGFAVVADAKSRYFPSVATNVWDRSGCVPGDWRGVSLCCNPQPAIRSLAVLPFRNLGTGTADDYFASGMTDAVTTELAKLGVSKVISETSVVQFKDNKKTCP